MQGHTDIPLNQEGQLQARGLQEYFLRHPVDFFFSSDLQRAHETARIANEQIQKPLYTEPSLREVSLGVLEGMELQEAQSQFGSDAWAQWSSLDPQHLDFRFPEAESPREAISRMTLALQNICLNYDFQNVGICTHGYIMRRFLHSLRPDLTEMIPTPNCVVYTVTWSESSRKFQFLF